MLLKCKLIGHHMLRAFFKFMSMHLALAQIQFYDVLLKDQISNINEEDSCGLSSPVLQHKYLSLE